MLDTLGVHADRCLMIGNNIAEDMIAEKIGIRTYLVRDYLENPEKADPDAYAGGSYRDLAEMLSALPAIK